MVTEWKDKMDILKTIDVRGIQGNFFQGIKKQAIKTNAGEGIEIIQSFDPIPLYEVMEDLGFEHYTEQKVLVNFMPISIARLKRKKKRIFQCVRLL
ncbi:MAG: DUF2249 domain-containing protein [Faecalicoccus sp.]|nr:DUF2249 domain-containing protein [Faecalicoccus sp.]